MKIKKSQLRRIVQEEIENILLNEVKIPDLPLPPMPGWLRRMLGLGDEAVEATGRVGRRAVSTLPTGASTESAADVLQRSQSDMAAYLARLERETSPTSTAAEPETSPTSTPETQVTAPPEPTPTPVVEPADRGAFWSVRDPVSGVRPELDPTIRQAYVKEVEEDALQRNFEAMYSNARMTEDPLMSLPEPPPALQSTPARSGTPTTTPAPQTFDQGQIWKLERMMDDIRTQRQADMDPQPRPEWNNPEDLALFNKSIARIDELDADQAARELAQQPDAGTADDMRAAYGRFRGFFRHPVRGSRRRKVAKWLAAIGVAGLGAAEIHEFACHHDPDSCGFGISGEPGERVSELMRIMDFLPWPVNFPESTWASQVTNDTPGGVGPSESPSEAEITAAEAREKALIGLDLESQQEEEEERPRRRRSRGMSDFPQKRDDFGWRNLDYLYEEGLVNEVAEAVLRSLKEGSRT